MADVYLLFAGDRSLIVDMGAGTTDIVGLELRDDLSRDSRFDAVSEETGGLCAGQGINDYLLDVVESSQTMQTRGGMETVAVELEMTVHALRRSLLQEIEDFKLKFEERSTFPLSIRATKGGNTNRFEYDFSKYVTIIDTEAGATLTPR